MKELTIYRLYFTKSDCYKKGVRIKPCGVQVHSTGANNPWLRRYVGPDDGRLGVNPNGDSGAALRAAKAVYYSRLSANFAGSAARVMSTVTLPMRREKRS